MADIKDYLDKSVLSFIWEATEDLAFYNLEDISFIIPLEDGLYNIYTKSGHKIVLEQATGRKVAKAYGVFLKYKIELMAEGKS